MQAQAAGGGAGAGDGAQGLLQNPKVQIGVVIAGLLAVGAVIFMIFGNSSPAAPPPPELPGSNPAAGGAPGGPPGLPGSGTPGLRPASGAPGPSARSPVATPGGNTTALPGGPPSMPGAPASPRTPAAGAETPKPAQGPGVKTRANPFKPNSEIAAVIKSIPIEKIFEDTTVAPPQDIWQELNPPKAAKEVVNADEAGEGPAIPPMRVSGFIEGNQLSAILQIGSPPSARYEQAVPGKTFTYGPNTYRVDRIEQGRVILVNRWEQGEKKGIQRIEVTLAGSSGRS